MLEYLPGDLVRSPTVGIDIEGGRVFVHGQSCVVEGFEIVTAKHRTKLIVSHASQGFAVADPQVDHSGVAQGGPGSLVAQCAASQREHGMPAGESCHGLMLQLSEESLSFGLEDIPDRSSEALLDQDVGIDEG